MFGEKGIEKGGSNSDTKPAAFMLAITSLFAKFCSSPLDKYSNAFLCPVLTALQPHLMRQLVAAGNTPIRGLQTSGCDDSPPGFYDTFGEEDTGNNFHDLQLDFKGTEQPLKHSAD